MNFKKVIKFFQSFQVHHGFYYAYHNTTLRDGILDGVLHAKNLYGDIGIIVTGHSMGGAIASFCALDLAVNSVILFLFMNIWQQCNIMPYDIIITYQS